MADYYVKLPSNSSGAAGVSSLNSLTGALTLVPGTGISIVPSGSTITISSTIGGGTVTSFSFTNGGGFTGSVSNPTSTPNLSLTATLTGDVTGPLTANHLTATSNSTLTTLSALSLPYSQITGAPAALTFNAPLSLSGNAVSIFQSGVATDGYLSSVDWNSFAGKQPAGSYITALTGDGTASGPGSAAFTLSTVNSNVGPFGTTSSVGSFTVNGKGLITAASNTAIQIAESQVTNLVSDLASKLTATLPSADIFVGNGSNVATAVPVSGDIHINNTGLTGIVATTNSTLTTLSALSLPYSQITGAPAAITALTGDGTATGPGSVAFTLSTVNSNVGSFGSASSVGEFTVNAKGLITAASSAAIQIAESQVTNLVSDLAGKQPVGNYITALTGQVTASGPGSVAATIATNTVSNSNLAQMPTNTIKGNNTGSTANAADLTVAQVNAILPVFTSTLNGLAPASGGGTTNFLRADGTWASPAGGGITALTGDVTASGPGSAAASLVATSNSTLTTLSALTTASNLSTVGTITSGVWNGTVNFGFSFLTSGTTYTTPANISIRTVFKFILVGGGGGGGGINTTNGHGCGGGGAGVGVLYISGLSPSTAYTIAIGAGGAAGSDVGPTAGGAGGTTSLTIDATTYTATGGAGGAAAASTLSGGVAGTSTNCTITIVGQPGGGTGVADAAVPNSPGGSTGLGFGIGAMGAQVFLGNEGNNGRGYGGGGAGAGPGPGFGGNASSGCILVEWHN